MNLPMPYAFPNMPMGQPGFNPFNKLPMAPPLYVGDLDENIHEETLHDFFSRFGPLHFVRIMRDQTSGKSRGFGFVNFLYPRDAETARQYAQYEKLGRKHIRIMFKRNVRDLPSEANIYIKNLDPNVTVKDVHSLFSQVGPILSCRVAVNNEGISLGYGYVQFEKKEDADRCLQVLQGTKLKENELQLHPFVSKDKRPETAPKKNVYVKNLPKGAEAELEASVKKLFAKYGEVETLLVKKHPTEDKHFAFICFADQESAQKAVEDLTANPTTMDGSDEPLYISWHQGKTERARDLKRQYQQSQNVTNLFVKNIKPEVNEAVLKSVFQQFGKVTSVACKDWISKDTQKKARFGFVAFGSEDDARRALSEGLAAQEVNEIFLPEAQPYIGFHQSKERRSEYLSSQKKWKQQANAIGNVNNFNNMQQQMRRFPPLPMPMNFNPQNKPPMSRGGARQHRGGWRGGAGPQRGGAPHRGGVRGPVQHGQQQQQQPRVGGAQGAKPIGGPATKAPVQNQPSGQAQTQSNSSGITVQNLRGKLQEFLALDDNRQRQILGEMLFPLVKQISGDQLAPKITGMLIDLSVLEVTEILEFLENTELLVERVQEAVELIQSEGL